VETTGLAIGLTASPDRKRISADGHDLSFVTVKIIDQKGQLVPQSNHLIEFDIEGPGEILATDNGDASDMDSFVSHKRKAFNGQCLVIVRTFEGKKGNIQLIAKSKDLKQVHVSIKAD